MTDRVRYRCFKCRYLLPAREMVFLHGKPFSICLQCNREKVAEWKRKNRKKTSRITGSYEKRNKEKRKAYGIVRWAKSRGRFKYSGSCCVCGKSGKIHAHHNDYSKPFEVEFLCPQCHSIKHSTRKDKTHGYSS